MSLFYKKISTKNAATIFAVAVMLMSGLYGITASLDNGGSLNTNLNTGGISGYSPPAQTSMLPIASYIPAVEKYHISQPTLLPQLNIGRDIHVTVFLKQPRQVALNDFLANLSNPRSSEYHKYLTMEQFDSQFGGNAAAYAQIVQYLQSQGVTHVRTSYDRLSVSFSASQQVVQCVFGVKMGLFSGNGHVFYMPESNPVLPATISGYISGVSGLSNYSRFLIHYAPLGQLRAISYAGGSKTASSGYLAPPTVNGVQFIYGSDMQVAYDEQGLFTQYGYPNGTVIATILWGGQYTGSPITTPYGSLTTGQYVGSFVPSNIYDYYNETLPSYEPHSHVYGVPLSGAPPPGHLAAFDSTGAVFENTLDLEMAGSTAPGSSIYNVYSNSNSLSSLVSDFSYVLNPNASYKALDNVSVISNSWGSKDINCTGWLTYLQEAQARGITVLAASGDSGDNSASSKYFGSQLWFPASMAYNTFGTIAVGGTTVTLNANLEIQSQINWNISSSDTADGGPVGTTSGISSIFKEPSWQLDSSANALIAGSGRGVPDIAAIANNTLITITCGNYTYYASNASTGGLFYYSWGTSIASPLTAGIIAEIDHVLNTSGEAKVGFLDPTLYALGNMQYQKQTNTSTTGYLDTGGYNLTTSMNPFFPVIKGNNNVYHARYGYSLLDGWGSIDAYNLTGFLLNASFKQDYYALSGVCDNLSLSYLKVTSYNTTSGAVYTTYNASIQQNFFLANEMGQPTYWVQNVIYIVGSNASGFSVYYTGWVIYPFYGLYPGTVYRYNFPLGEVLKMPHYFNIKTLLDASTSLMNRSVSFYVNLHEVTLPVPGAAYIIGSLNYSYYFRNYSLFGGPYPDNIFQGGLSPQFAIVGGPSLMCGDYMPPTSGTIVTRIEPMSGNAWIIPSTTTFDLNNTQTGETAKNLYFTSDGNGKWNVGIRSGSGTQGIISYNVPGYLVSFIPTNLPSSVVWYVNISNASGPVKSGHSTGKIEFCLLNGSYNFTISSTNKSYAPSIYSGSFRVSSLSVNESIAFSLVTYAVTFAESHLPAGTEWYVNVTGEPSISGTASTLSTDLPNGSYSFTASSVDKSYGFNGGNFAVNGAATPVNVAFQASYLVSFSETGLPAGDFWFVNITGRAGSGSIGTSSYSVMLINGTYAYTVSTSDKDYRPSYYSGSVGVDAAPASAAVVKFSAVNYTVTFVSSDRLPSTWYVNISGQSMSGADGANITYDLSNGTYTYSVAIQNKTYSPSSYTGTFAVSGKNSTIDVYSHIVLFSTTFASSGLPSADTWYVNVSSAGGGKLGYHGSGTISTQLTNGSYTYTVASSDKDFAPDSYTGTFTVTGSSSAITVAFHPVLYTVKFTESGLPSGTQWSVTMNGNSVSSSNQTAAFAVTNGSYSYSVSSVNGYSLNRASGTVNVSGSGVTLSMTYTANPAPPSIPIYYVIAGILVLAVIAGIILTRRRKT